MDVINDDDRQQSNCSLFGHPTPALATGMLSTAGFIFAVIVVFMLLSAAHYLDYAAVFAAERLSAPGIH